MKIDIVDNISLSALVAITHDLRAWDQVEARAAFGPVDPDHLAAICWAQSADAVAKGLLQIDGKPAWVIYATRLTPRCASITGFGRPLVESAPVAMTKWVVRHFIPALLSKGVERGECRVHEENERAALWLQATGHDFECVVPHYGVDGETFYQYAWNKRDHDVPEKSHERPVRRSESTESRAGGDHA